MRHLPLLLCLFALTSCARKSSDTPVTQPATSFLTTSDGLNLSLRHWNLQPDPDTVLIGLHGIEGAARDYKNLGKKLTTRAPRTTLYALNLRGNGYHPEPHKRGDIASTHLWKRDLLELQKTLRHRHPHARFIWIGESMGSLIALHAATDSTSVPDGLVLASPVVSLDAIPKWQTGLLKTAAALAPGARVSLQTLAGGSFQATTKSDHFQQIETNPYHVESYTLRYLKQLATLSQSATDTAQKVETPVLILHGSKDFLSTSQQLSTFAHSFPNKPAERHQFKDSHHLLFYDKQKQEVIKTILDWCTQEKL